jgi:group I intron endonuclease
MGTVNLREAFVADFDSLPKWLWSERCIYKITNIINNHAYIGQAAVLIGRLRVNGGWSHLGSLINSSRNKYYRSHLYNAIRKYKSRNFIVEVLEANIDNLDEREVYWIDYYNTFEGPGYNMNRGGEDKSHLYTPEVNQRRNENGMKTCYERYGRLPIHSEESLKHSLETRALQGNGDTMWMCHTPEILARSHTPEAKAKWKETYHRNREEYLKNPKNVEAERLSYLQMQTTMLERYGVKIGFHLDGVQDKARITKMLATIERNIQFLKDNHLELTAYNYKKFPMGNSHGVRHTRDVLHHLNEFKLDERWTEEMDTLFSLFSLGPNDELIY